MCVWVCGCAGVSVDLSLWLQLLLLCFAVQLSTAEVSLLRAGVMETQLEAFTRENRLLQQRCDRLESELASAVKKKNLALQELQVGHS